MLSVTLASWLLVALARASCSDISRKECQLHDVTSMLQISRIVAGGEDRVIGDTSREDDILRDSLASEISGAIAAEIRGAVQHADVAASLAKPADVSLEDSAAIAAVLATTTNPVYSGMTTSSSLSDYTTTWESETNEQAGVFNGMTLPPDQGCLGPNMTSNEMPWQPCEATTPTPAAMCATTADCLNGYYCLNEFCEANSCTCENGVAATGAACAMNLGAICASCHGGYTLNADSCEAHCTCNHGVAATGAACNEMNGAICASCDEGYNLVGNVCEAHSCTCDHGVAATGAVCAMNFSVSNNGAICASCDGGYNLNGDVCEANVCTCLNGVAATGAACTANNGDSCASCDDGYTLNGEVCTAQASPKKNITYSPSNVFLLRIRTATAVGCNTDDKVHVLVDNRQGQIQHESHTEVAHTPHKKSTGWLNLQGVDPSHDTFELGGLDEFTVPVLSNIKFIPKRICLKTIGHWCPARQKPSVSIYDAMKAKGKSAMYGTASGYSQFNSTEPQCEPVVLHQEAEADINEG